jgi:hypothetical protein
MGRSEYVTRKGKRFDKGIIKMVEKWRDTDKIAVFDFPHAEELWQCALDGDKLTERERETLRFVLTEFKWEEDAAKMLADHVDPPASGEGYHIEIKGQQLQREVWDEVVKQTQDGNLDVDEAKLVYEKAAKGADGKLTECAVLTLWAVLDEFKTSPNAFRWIEEKLPPRATKAEEPAPAPEPIMLMSSSAPPPPKPAAPAPKPATPPPQPAAAAAPPPASKAEDDEFIKLTKKWLYESMPDDDFFTRVQPFLPPISV